MGKKNKKKKVEDLKIDRGLLSILTAIDMNVMMEEAKPKEWKAEDHTDIENYLHYRANLAGR